MYENVTSGPLYHLGDVSEGDEDEAQLYLKRSKNVVQVLWNFLDHSWVKALKGTWHELRLFTREYTRHDIQLGDTCAWM